LTDVHVVDLSPSGALLESRRHLASGSELSIELALVGEALAVRAEVVHCNEHEDKHLYRVGVQFVGLPTSQQERIRDYIRESLTQERREQPRIFVGQPAQLKKEIRLTVLNLSLFGGLFSGSFPLEFRSEHDFVFTLPPGAVHARGVVRHCEAWAEARGAAIFRLGVEFTRLDGENRERVVSYLETADSGYVPPVG
jgi:c-di-GMP-binding flagellar brake protein YcgR